MEIVSEPLFRPVKRRKFMRKRPDEELDNIEASTSPPGGTSASAAKQSPAVGADSETGVLSKTEDADADDGAPSVSEILRRRRPLKGRRLGIEFSAGSNQRAGGQGASGSRELTAQELEDEQLRAISERFVQHTGQKVDVNRHMMEYIETELAKRQQQRAEPAETDRSSTTIRNDDVTEQPSASSSNLPQRQPASLGKLHEIDLGPDAKLENIARTEAAAKRLGGQDTPEEEETPQKTRLGPDGKPWRSRKRRTSQDVLRDKLVEEVLRESKLDVYDEPEEEVQADDDQAADDRIAEQFRRDFLEAIQSRRRGTRTKTAKPTAVKGAVVPKGPKLGGSRSARAAMREKQEKEGQK